MIAFQNKPFFILGNPRSGTSLLRIALNAHPNIVVPPESGFLQWWSNKYENWCEDDNSSKLGSFISDLLSSKKIETFKFQRNELYDFIKGENPKIYSELIACIYIFYAKDKDLLAWGDKNNYYIHHIPLLKELFPEARFIHLVRDGRDVACSYRELNQNIKNGSKYRPVLSSDIQKIALEWMENNLKIEENIKSTDHIVVRFEDIIKDFKGELDKVLSFLKVPWSDQILKFYLKNDEPAATIKWKRKTQATIQGSVVGRYLNELSLQEIALFERCAQSELVKYQYC